MMSSLLCDLETFEVWLTSKVFALSDHDRQVDLAFRWRVHEHKERIAAHIACLHIQRLAAAAVSRDQPLPRCAIPSIGHGRTVAVRLVGAIVKAQRRRSRGGRQDFVATLHRLAEAGLLNSV